MGYGSLCDVMPPPARYPPTPPRLRGRDTEMERISGRLGALRDGRGSVTLISGAPGSGKSRLLEEAARVARRMSARVGVGRAKHGDVVVPMNVLMGALFDGTSPLLDRASLRDLSSGPEQRYWLIQELEGLLETASMERPILIVLDDLQWADSGTAAALDALTVRLSGVPIAWIGSFRPGELPDHLRATASRLLADGGDQQLQLGPLDEEAVTQVIADHAGGVPDGALLNLTRSTHGMPFWLMELLLGLREEGLIAIEDGAATLREHRLPARVRETMRERLHRMSPRARRTVTVASVLGNRFGFDTLSGMLDVTASALLEPVEELLDADLLCEDNGSLSFRHDILRDAVLDSIPATARAPLERQAVDVLLAAGTPPVEVATQLASSAQPGDSAAIDLLTRAAHALGASDPTAAAELSRRALELTARDDPRRGPLIAESALLLHAAGKLDEGKAFAELALNDLLPVDQEAAVLFSIAGMFSLSADARADAGRRALALRGLPPAERARHNARLIHNVLDAGRARDARRLIEQVDQVCDDAEVTFPLALVNGGLMYVDEDFRGSLALVETAAKIGAASGDDARIRMSQLWRGEVLSVLDRYDEAFALSATGLQDAQRDAQAWAMRFWEQLRGRHLFHVGDLSDAAATLEGMFRPEEPRMALGANDASSLGSLGRTALHLGEQRLVGICAKVASDMLRLGTPEVRRHAAWLLAQQAMSTGDAKRARNILVSCGPDPDERLLPCFPFDVMSEPQLVRIARGAGDPELARAAVESAETRASRNPGIPSLQGAAAHARGLFAVDAVALAAAVDALESSPRRPALASALEDAGVVAIKEGRRDDAVAFLGRALGLTVEIGAASDAMRLRARLRGLGVLRRSVGSERPTTGWASLTKSEHAVVQLVTRGMTNREVAEQLFVSPHTVNAHLRHVFTKLGIGSRVELTRIATKNETA